eukprot:TRINITY_DN12715_c0_g1_i10.p1 TRINITY_DN12715_c0_g1~~TRINITY_DN12715_c0_g1_i10.p1  ORF type:complete len:375 (-),score=61.19 TRINITY_DN12715_c0_g1_i10:44-1168(-)
MLKFLEVEGEGVQDLWTRSPDIAQVRRLQAVFQNAGTACFPNGCDPKVVAGLLLLFLHELPESIVQAELYDCFLAVHDMPDNPTKLKNLSHLCSNMRPLHRAVLIRIIRMLRRGADQGKSMDGMAIIFGPLLIRSPRRSSSIRYFGLPAIVSSTQALIENLHAIVAKLGQLAPAGPADPIDLTLRLDQPEGVLIRARPALFGPAIGQLPTIQAQVIMTDPPTAQLPIQNRAQISGNIALITRGDCSFSHKVLEAQEAGAVGVVVVNDSDQELLHMNSDPTSAPVTIPSLMISRHDGLQIQRALPRVVCTFSPDPFPRQSPPASQTSAPTSSNCLSQLDPGPVSYTHLRAHETPEHLVCRLLLEKKKKKKSKIIR